MGNEFWTGLYAGILGTTALVVPICAGLLRWQAVRIVVGRQEVDRIISGYHNRAVPVAVYPGPGREPSQAWVDWLGELYVPAQKRRFAPDEWALDFAEAFILPSRVPPRPKVYRVLP